MLQKPYKAIGAHLKQRSLADIRDSVLTVKNMLQKSPIASFTCCLLPLWWLLSQKTKQNADSVGALLCWLSQRENLQIDKNACNIILPSLSFQNLLCSHYSTCSNSYFVTHVLQLRNLWHHCMKKHPCPVFFFFFPKWGSEQIMSGLLNYIILPLMQNLKGGVVGCLHLSPMLHFCPVQDSSRLASRLVASQYRLA